MTYAFTHMGNFLLLLLLEGGEGEGEGEGEGGEKFPICVKA